MADSILRDNEIIAIWQCPDCKRRFGAIISKRVRVPSKCPYCVDGQAVGQLDLFNEAAP